MKNRWNFKEFRKCGNNLLMQRIYTSRLLGRDPDLVLSGGGNTSVKIIRKNIFGEKEELLYVKGSGGDLAEINENGFSPVRLNILTKLAELAVLPDEEMVKSMRAAMINPDAPAPSIEAIVHAVIPFTFVDHTHADAVVTITNTKNGTERIKNIFGDTVLIIPYVMPGFILAKEIFKRTKNVNWKKIKGIILVNHGIFTFHDSPQESYRRMIGLVTKAEQYLRKSKTVISVRKSFSVPDVSDIAAIRRAVSMTKGKPVLAFCNTSVEAVSFSNKRNCRKISGRGTLTPDHVIRIKPFPAYFTGKFERDINRFAEKYNQYFKKFSNRNHIRLDSAPKWAVWPGNGLMTFGSNVQEIESVSAICAHTIRAIVKAEKLGGWRPLPLKKLFAIEYWSLEQAKLKKNILTGTMQGKIALVTGAASGIGRACVEKLLNEGAAVAALDINPEIISLFPRKECIGIQCDVTDKSALQKSVEQTILRFGGLDMVVSNAGIFPESKSIAGMDLNLWYRSMEINLNSHLNLLKFCAPYLEKGIDPSVVVIASKNVPAPGPGAGAYSVAKAGLTQLARVAALEIGKKGIRINVIHPNAVFDTGSWNEKVLKERARYYGLTVDEYKTNNILKIEVLSKDVAEAAFLFLGKSFSKTTGAQVPVDGGNERVI